jgi:hypothetical protein
VAQKEEIIVSPTPETSPGNEMPQANFTPLVQQPDGPVIPPQVPAPGAETMPPDAARAKQLEDVIISGEPPVDPRQKELYAAQAEDLRGRALAAATNEARDSLLEQANHAALKRDASVYFNNPTQVENTETTDLGNDK